MDWRIEWRGPSGENINSLTNIRGEGEENGVVAQVVSSGSPVTGFKGEMGLSNSLPIDRNRYYYATFYGDLNINIPWNNKIEDGEYRINSRISNLRKQYLDGYGNVITANYNNDKRSGYIRVEIRTYIDLNFQDVDFGKVIFTKNTRNIIKNGAISLLGGPNSQINISLLDSNIFLKKAKGNEFIPAFLKLVDNANSGDNINVRLDSSGRKNLRYEAKIEPGLYPDIPEGKYAGVARFEVKYN